MIDFLVIVASLVLIVGIFMLMFAFIKKKPKKKAVLITVIGFVLSAIVGSLLPPTEEVVVEKEPVVIDDEKEKEKKAAEDEAEKLKQKAAEEKKIVEEKAIKKEKAKKKLPIDKKIVKENDHVDEAAIDDKGILTLSYNATAAWSENSIVTTYTYWMFEAMNEGFKDPSVNEVEASIKTTVTDNKGNSSIKEVASFLYARDTFEELNYEGFLNLASGQEWRIYNESDVYQLYPVIFNNIKDDYRNNLISGISKYPPVTD